MKRANQIQILQRTPEGFYSIIKYDAKNVAYGDTDSVYLDLSSVFPKNADVDDVVTFADWLGGEVNDAFPQFMNEVFNVPDERCNIIQTEREIVSDKSVFIKKKKYALHVVDNEGKRCDKMKIMGLEIKKSDTPVVVQRFLSLLIDEIINGKEYEEIKTVIENFKQEYMKMSIFEIGNPKSVRVLSKYVEQYEETGTMKGIPQHVRAAMLYNANRSNRDRPIYPGDKIKIVYTKLCDFEYIGIPSDATKIPSFLKGIQIDYQRQWETVEKKIELYLEAIEMDKKSRNKNIAESLFTF